MPKELNPLLHSQLRLGVMSILMVKSSTSWREQAISPSKKALKGNAHAPHAASPPKEGPLLRSTSIR